MVIGIDEVGRGSWAGPLVFAGVSLPENFEYHSKLRDSKKLTSYSRETLSEIIKKDSYYKIASVDNRFIDKFGLTAASEKACLIILDYFQSLGSFEVILDGSINFLKNTKFKDVTRCLIKADSLENNTMAASIIAKNYRDKIMIEYSNQYKGYGFDKNFGYGTKKHIDALADIGISKIHRLSYKPIKKYI